MSPSNIPRTLALTALRRLPLVADRERSGLVVVLMAALLCATPALAQYQSPSTSAAAGGSCSGSNFIFPDANGHILQCVSSVWTAVSDAVWSVSGSSIYYNGGNVGIGNTGPSYPLDVTGDIRTSTCLHYASSTLGTCSSDAAIKRDVAPYVLGLDAVAGLKPVTYAYNGLGGNPDDGRRMIGLIAQDVGKTVPQLVGTRRVKLHPGDKTDTEIRTVDYGSLTYMLINAVKELKSRFDGDHEEMAKVKADNDNLATRVRAEDDALKAANDNIAGLRARLGALEAQSVRNR